MVWTLPELAPQLISHVHLKSHQYQSGKRMCSDKSLSLLYIGIRSGLFCVLCKPVILLTPSHAAFKLLLPSLSSILFLYCNLALFISALTSLVASLFSSSSPLWKALFFHKHLLQGNSDPWLIICKHFNIHIPVSCLPVSYPFRSIYIEIRWYN